jgi:hypothetical protein
MADVLDVIDPEEAKAFLGRKGEASSARLATQITAISRRLDQACGAVVVRTITGEAHDGGFCQVRLHHPVTTFTTVTEYAGTSSTVLTRETVGTQPASGYYAEALLNNPAIFSGTITRRGGGVDIPFYFGRGNVTATYQAGRYATTALVAPHFREAALIMLRNLVGAAEPGVQTVGEFETPGGRFPMFAIPPAAHDLLWQEYREIPGVG